MTERYEPGPVPREGEPQEEPPPATNRYINKLTPTGSQPASHPAIERLISLTGTSPRSDDLENLTEQRLKLAREFRQSRERRPNGS